MFSVSLNNISQEHHLEGTCLFRETTPTDSGSGLGCPEVLLYHLDLLPGQ